MIRVCLLLFIPLLLCAQAPQKWLDSTYNSLSLDQKVGQLFMVMAYPDGDAAAQAKTASEIKKHVGGVVFSKGSAKQQLVDTKRYQGQSEIPLLIGVDAEWGMAMRLEDVSPYPFQMTLGALQANDLIYALGKRMGARKKALGVHVSFSPVADVNTTPKNPIIGIRSFGDNPQEVAQKSQALAAGLQDAGLLAVAKHFPGHGAATQDSHKTLPQISRSRAALDSIDIFPFHELIKNNIGGVMVGHLEVPALDPRKNRPVSTSKAVVTQLLQDSLAFSGLIFTDALNMAGIIKTTTKPALACFLAGADILLIPESLTTSVANIKQAYQQGIISEQRLATSVKKILQAKYSMGLFEGVAKQQLRPVADTYEDRYIKQQIAAQSITLVHKRPRVFPLNQNTSIAYISLGKERDNTFLGTLRNYADVVQYHAEAAKDMQHTTVVVGVHANTTTPWTAQLFSAADKELLQELAKLPDVHLVVFSKAYALQGIDQISRFSSVLMAYEQQPEFAISAAQLLFGVLEPKGKLPVSFSTPD